MSYEDKWKTLSDLLIEIQKMGEKIPSKVMNDLRSAKTIIQVLKRDPNHMESLSRVEVYLKNVEAYAVFVAEKKGPKMVQDWLKRINQPEKRNCTKSREIIVGPKVSRDKKWIRIKPTDELRFENVQKLSENVEVSVKVEENGDILVFGDEKNVKSFVKAMAKQFQASRKG
ncbi:MAG: DUF2096 family protein [Candidatus Bathyarchaeota archaeon]|nr:DUF2096 family protein [Candidatus Bathyarchaeum tardum]WGM90235.1 MAG: DUF2096 family protein [Candidatus Bathyarchaeum tardum]WNZ29680.1 MAG: DUF2096 family protein [Candidatus Bathyarchaeota archaeon]